MSEKKIENPLQTMRGFYRKHVEPFYEEAHRAKKEGKPVAWVASTTPIEILHAMDIIAVWPENYASVCAALQTSLKLCQAAERKGFSKDLCSYAKCVLGSIYEPVSLPAGGLPEPDFLIAATGACDTHLKWFQVVSRIYRKPLFLLDMPYNVTGVDGDNLEKTWIEHYKKQITEMIEFIEKQTGKEMDKNRLKKVVELSNKCNDLWTEIMNYRKETPCPMGAREAFSAILFMLSFAGTKRAIQFYEELRDEVKGRVKEGKGIIENEKYRLLWDNLPLWYNLGLFSYLRQMGAVVAVEAFSLVWAGKMDPSKPFESLARKHIPNYSNSSIDRKIEWFTWLSKEYKLNGLILAGNWGCRMMSIGEIDVRDAIQERLGIPSLVLDVDAADPRNSDMERVKANLRAFVEMLGKKK